MLFELLDNVVSRISKLNPRKEIPVFLNQLKSASPEYWESLRKNIEKKKTKKEVVALIEQGIAAGVYAKIKEIPKIVRMMTSKINDMQTSPAMRCALVGVLALLVKPRDLIPDDAPGGYGFLDDAILLRAALVEYMNVMPPSSKSLDEEQKILQFMSIGVPPHAIPQFQAAIAGMQVGFMLLHQLPPELLNMTTQMLIQNPMLAEIQSTPQSAQQAGTSKLPSAVETRNLLGQSLLTEGGNVSMTFGDGSSAFLSESGDLSIVTD